MHDKLEIIWDRPKSEFTNKNEGNFDNGNQLEVKIQLEKKKAERLFGNKMQVEGYNKMLEYVNSRIMSKYSKICGRPDKIYIHEKEREFFDAIRLII